MLRADQGWRRSSRCDTNACVEVAARPTGGAALRDSADPASPELDFGPHQWRTFLGGISRGQLTGR